jgi:hypothetical protein
MMLEDAKGEEGLLVRGELLGWAEEVYWDSPARADTFTLSDLSFFHSILLEVCGTPVA